MAQLHLTSGSGLQTAHDFAHHAATLLLQVFMCVCCADTFVASFYAKDCTMYNVFGALRFVVVIHEN